MAENPKRPPRGAPPPAPAQKKVELPFDEGEVQPLRADDPRPQRVPQFPTGGRRLPAKAGSALASRRPSKDLEMEATYGGSVSEPGFRPAYLYVERGPGQGQLVPVKQGALVVGRASSADLRVQHPSISRRHALIDRRDERFFVKDLGSQNGTFVNKSRVSGEVEFSEDDVLVLGQTQLKLRRSGKLPEVSEVSVSNTGARDGHRTVRIAAFTLAVGIGLCGVVVFALLSLNRGPSFEQLEVQGQPRGQVPDALDDRAAMDALPANAPVPDPEAARAEAARTEPVRAEPSRPEPSRPESPVRAAPAAKPSRSAAASAPSAPKVEALDEAEADEAPAPRRSEPAPAPAPVKPRAAAAEPAPAAKPSRAWMDPAVFKPYVAGRLAEAVQNAKRVGPAELAARLTRFQTEYAAGQRALGAQDEAGALRALGAALALDEELGVGQSPYRPELKKQLSSLHTLSGFRALSAKDAAGAKREFGTALELDPSNTRAKVQLAKLGSAKPAAPSESSDEAFEAKPAPAKAVPAKPAGDDIDAAFGE